MKTLLIPALAGAVALVPAIAAAQTADGSVSIGAITTEGVAPAPTVTATATAGAPAVAPTPQPAAAPAPPPPVVYVAPAPVAPAYAYPPGYSYPAGYAYAPRLRREVPYSGGPVPAGAHLESRPIMGLVIAGAISLGVGYLPAGLAALGCTGGCTSSGVPWLGLPILGPFIAMGYRQDDSSTRLLILDSILQVGGLGMLIAGMVARNHVVVYDNVASNRPRRIEWTVAPGAPGAPAGMSLALTHF